MPTPTIGTAAARPGEAIRPAVVIDFMEAVGGFWLEWGFYAPPNSFSVICQKIVSRYSLVEGLNR